MTLDELVTVAEEFKTSPHHALLVALILEAKAARVANAAADRITIDSSHAADLAYFDAHLEYIHARDTTIRLMGK